MHLTVRHRRGADGDLEYMKTAEYAFLPTMRLIETGKRPAYADVLEQVTFVKARFHAE